MPALIGLALGAITCVTTIPSANAANPDIPTAIGLSRSSSSALRPGTSGSVSVKFAAQSKPRAGKTTLVTVDAAGTRHSYSYNLNSRGMATWSGRVNSTTSFTWSLPASGRYKAASGGTRLDVKAAGAMASPKSVADIATAIGLSRSSASPLAPGSTGSVLAKFAAAGKPRTGTATLVMVAANGTKIKHAYVLNARGTATWSGRVNSTTTFTWSLPASGRYKAATGGTRLDVSSGATETKMTAAIGSGTTYTLIGTVSSHGKPLAGAPVRLYGGTTLAKTANTASNGRVQFMVAPRVATAYHLQAVPAAPSVSSVSNTMNLAAHLTALPTPAKSSAQTVWLLVGTGQSNMSGRGEFRCSDGYYTTWCPNSHGSIQDWTSSRAEMWKWSTGKIVPFTAQLSSNPNDAGSFTTADGDTRYGPMNRIAEQFVNHTPATDRVVVVQAAVGGTCLACNSGKAGIWAPDYDGPNPNLYEMGKDAVSKAYAAAKAKYPTAVIKPYIFWLQGATDSLLSVVDTPAEYADDLSDLITGIRTAFVGTKAPFVMAGSLVDSPVIPKVDIIDAEQAELASVTDKIAYVPGMTSIKGNHRGDNLHYNRAALQRIGDLMYSAAILAG